MKPKQELINPDDIGTNYHKDSSFIIVALAVLVMIAVCGYVYEVFSNLSPLYERGI